MLGHVSTSQWDYRFFLDGFWADFFGTDFVTDLTGLVGLMGTEGLEGGFDTVFGG